ncbi:MAG: cyclase family protein [Deltaproteobacteria bacterium]|nr:cyclase family protein [Deltaproteobacteria bacterium]
MAENSFEIIDLSRTLSSDMPIFPGSISSEISSAHTIEKNGFNEKKLLLYSHTGTHIDAPYHILKEGKSLDKFRLDYFMGNSFCIDVSNVKNGVIEIENLISFNNNIKKSDFLLLYTDKAKFWKTNEYFKSYPVLSEDATKFLADFSLKGIGIDAVSFDFIDSKLLPIHNILLNKNIILIENLCNLKKIINRHFIFCCFPLKIKNADGSPVRAAAIIKFISN